MVYEMRMYDLGRDDNKRSAHAIVPVLADYYHPASVIDVGCGEGWFLDEFAKYGVHRLVGVDSNPMRIPSGTFVQGDLTQPLIADEKFDLVLCLEVAEHLEAQYADTLVDSLCKLGDTIIFSAAIPKQGGHGHVNEQWQAYWAKLFEGYGYGVNTWLRRLFWDDERIEPWYIQNMLTFRKDGECELQGISVVHPRLWCPYRGC